MLVGTLKWIAGSAGGIILGFLLSLGITARHTETREIDGVPQRMVVFAVNTSEAKEGLFELPADLLPYRIVGKIDGTHQEAVCPAADHLCRLGLLFSIGGIILGWAFVCGAGVFKSLGAGVLAGGLVYVFCSFVSITRAVEPGVEFWAVLFALMAACGEAIYSLWATSGKWRAAEVVEAGPRAATDRGGH